MSTNAQIVHTTASNQELATLNKEDLLQHENQDPHITKICSQFSVLGLNFFLRITPPSNWRCCVKKIDVTTLVYCRLVQTYKCLNLFLKDSARWMNNSGLSGRTIVFSCLCWSGMERFLPNIAKIQFVHYIFILPMTATHTCKPLLEERRNPSREFARNPGWQAGRRHPLKVIWLMMEILQQ